jgi:hypothetical protein
MRPPLGAVADFYVYATGQDRPLATVWVFDTQAGANHFASTVLRPGTSDQARNAIMTFTHPSAVERLEARDRALSVMNALRSATR